MLFFAVNKDGNLSLPSNEVSIRVNSVPQCYKSLHLQEKNYVSNTNTITLKGTTDVNEAKLVEVYVNFEKQATPVINTNGTFEATLQLKRGEIIL